MFTVYGVYFILFYCSFYIIKKCFFIPSELRQIPSLPIIQNIRWNLGYILREPSVHMIRDHLMEPLNKKGIIKVYDMLFGRWIIFISKPELVKEVFTSDIFPIQKSMREQIISQAELKLIGLNNILFESGAAHLRHRRTANPAFSQNLSPELFGNLATELFEEMDKTCKKNKSLDIFHFTKAYTLDALGLAAFDYKFGLIRGSGNELEIAYNTAIREASNAKYTLFPILDKIPGFRRPYLMKRIDYLNNVILDIIKKRRQLLKSKKEFNNINNHNINKDDYNGPKDLLYYMLKSEESQDLKARLTTEELLNDLKVFLIAGHDTTAISLASAIYFLGMNQECQEKAREEAIRIMGDERKDVIPTPEQIKELKYINMIIHETMRIHPPVPMSTFRTAQTDTRLDKYVINKGTYIGLNIYATHYMEDPWEDPYKFKPERFANENNANQSFPFGGGKRICIGMNFSYAEQRVFLAMIVRKYSWQVNMPNIHKDKIIVEPTAFGLSVPKNLNINFERRY